MLSSGYELWATAAVLTKIIAYIPYFVETIKGRCNPHAFSWFIWFVIDFIASVVQYYGGAGAGAAATFLGGLVSLSLALLAWFIGKRDIARSDYIALGAAFSVLPLWYFVHSPLAVLCVIISVEFIGNFPTLRKATNKPYEERAYVFFLLGVSSIFALLAVEVITLENVLYPVYLITMCMLVTLYIIWRNKIVARRFIK